MESEKAKFVTVSALYTHAM